MRNKSYDINARKLFQVTSGCDTDCFDLFGKCFTRLISLMEEVINAFSKLKLTSIELNKMIENFVYAERIIDMNLWNRELKPQQERDDYKSVQVSINQVF